MISLLLAVAIVQATPSPVPAPSGWTTVPVKQGELFDYSRSETDSTTSQLVVSTQVCDCQPDHFQDLLTQAVSQIQGASVKRDKIDACGAHADRVIVTGLANGPRYNIEAIVFRFGDSLVTMSYFFAQPAPEADAEAALLTLCPPQSVSYSDSSRAPSTQAAQS
jgi:hypothetical protein